MGPKPPARRDSAVRSIPLETREERVPLQGNENSLLRSANRRVSHTTRNFAPVSAPPPPNLTPAQLEQWRNQQER